jgi:hypothetical protein
MSSTVISSFSLTQDNALFVKEFKNQSQFINKIIAQFRLAQKKIKLLSDYNQMADDAEEMNLWLEIANNESNL